MSVETIAEAASRFSRAFGASLETPLLRSLSTGQALGCDLRFKAENFQRTGSFKIRGASARLSVLQTDAGSRGIVTASSGNHGLACAEAGLDLNIPVTVVVPVTAAANKVDAIAKRGAEVIRHGEETGASERFARSLAAGSARTYVSPYNDPDIIAGQGTIAVELIAQAPRIDNVFVAMGGGGLIAGIGAVLKAHDPSIRVFGCSATASPALAASLAAGRVVAVEHRPTLADAVSGDMDPDAITLPIAQKVIDDVIDCDEPAINQALVRLLLEERMLVEGAAALALAGFLQVAMRLRGQTSVVVLCGSNISADKARHLLCDPRPS